MAVSPVRITELKIKLMDKEEINKKHLRKHFDKIDRTEEQRYCIHKITTITNRNIELLT
jgi:hypothetical protein